MGVRIETAPFDPGAETNAFLAEAAGAGAAVTFTGLVRSDPGDPVLALELECYPELAVNQVEAMLAEASTRFGLLAATIIHRYGRLAAGEPIVQVMTLAPHRQAAFAAAGMLMDFLKTDAPFWKKETTPDGARWIEAKPADDAARRRWNQRATSMDDTDRRHLERCVALAEAALATGNDPFGSVLVSAGGEVLFEGHNETAGGDETRHPEFDIAKWAATNLTPAERAAATVYTSGEHCPMCAAAHAWVGLGRIVYAGSSQQLGEWLAEIGAPAPPVATLPIQAVAPSVRADGPDPSLAGRLRDLHQERWRRRQAGS